MTFSNPDSHLNHPIFLEAMRHFQNGEWDAGIAQLDELKNSYPLEDDLRTLRQEMQLRAKIDGDEQEDIQIARRQKLTSWSVRIIVTVVIIGATFFGIRTYSTWIQGQLEIARQQVEGQTQALELSIKFRNAQNLLQAGRPEEAKVLFEDIKSVDPNYQDVDVFIAQAESMAALDGRYMEALSLLESGDADTALSIFKDIAQINPLYKDVSLQIDNIERGVLLDEIIVEAEEAFQGGDWETSVEKYESLRAVDPFYRTEDVEERLLLSYVNAADQVLDDPEGTIEALEVAEDYFRRALALRPQDTQVLARWNEARETIKDRLVNSYMKAASESISDQGDSLEALATAEFYFGKALELRPDDPDVLVEVDLVNNYLQALDEFRTGSWGQVINLLEFVFGEDPGYADGTARQTLYEAYIGRGEDGIISGEYELALTDFQRAAIIAQQDPDTVLQLYEAQLKVAYTQGLLFNYEGAVAMYQTSLGMEEVQSRVIGDNPGLAEQLAIAATEASQGDYSVAYLTYRQALNNNLQLYDDTFVHTVEEGEYLTMIARRFNTTIQAIVQANDLLDPNRIIAGQDLVIPMFAP